MKAKMRPQRRAIGGEAQGEAAKMRRRIKRILDMGKLDIIAE